MVGGAHSRTRVYTVDILRNAMAFGCHLAGASADLQRVFGLHFDRPKGTVRVPSRYVIETQNPLQVLETRLAKLSRAGELRRARIFLGVTSDPFLPSREKLERTLRVFKLFERYTPGLLHIQTRSPLLVLAMPVLRQLGRHVSVTLGIETHRADFAARFSPGLPRPEERLKAARTLRSFGIPVTLQVNPLLPYGDWRTDAPELAEHLCGAADHIAIEPLVRTVEEMAKMMSRSRLVQHLVGERKYFWTRPDSHLPLQRSIEEIAPATLETPHYWWLEEPQLELFRDSA